MFDKFKLVCIGATGIIFIASYFFVGVHYYRNGYETATKKYDEVLRVESEKNYQKIIETERNLTDKQNKIVSEYLKYIDDLWLLRAWLHCGYWSCCCTACQCQY